MIEWTQVNGSTRVIAEAYDAESERIYVRFPNGVEWWYAGCTAQVWEEFTRVGQSRGQYIDRVLNYKQHGRHSS